MRWESVTGIVAVVLLLIALVLRLAGVYTIGGLPLADAGQFAAGYLAAGNFAIGVFAAGIFSVGIFAAGIFSIGIFAIGIFSIGVFSIGSFALGIYCLHLATAREQKK